MDMEVRRSDLGFEIDKNIHWIRVENYASLKIYSCSSTGLKVVEIEG